MRAEQIERSLLRLSDAISGFSWGFRDFHSEKEDSGIGQAIFQGRHFDIHCRRNNSRIVLDSSKEARGDSVASRAAEIGFRKSYPIRSVCGMRIGVIINEQHLFAPRLWTSLACLRNRPGCRASSQRRVLVLRSCDHRQQPFWWQGSGALSGGTFGNCV